MIAEVKRRSPSKGDLDPGLDPAALAADYDAGGAACLSVLTDGEYFGGSARRPGARPAPPCALPGAAQGLHRVSAADVCDARLMGADAVLLIVAALSDAELAELPAPWPGELGLDALVEVHDEAELDRALAPGPTLVGVNQRDLTTFAVDADRAARLAAADPRRRGGGGRVGDPGRGRRRPPGRRRLPGRAGGRVARAGRRPRRRGAGAHRAPRGARGRCTPRRGGRGEPVLVKICGITSEADALLAVGLGADAVGFIFAPSPRQVAPQAVRRIIERLPPEILTVGVFRDEAPSGWSRSSTASGCAPPSSTGTRRRGHAVGGRARRRS